MVFENEFTGVVLPEFWVLAIAANYAGGIMDVVDDFLGAVTYLSMMLPLCFLALAASLAASAWAASISIAF